MQPPDASVQVSTELIERDTGKGVNALPLPAPELFLEAGFIVAGRAARAAAGQLALEEIVLRAVQHAVALRDPVVLRDSS